MKKSILYLYNNIENYLLDDIRDRHSFVLFQKGLFLYLLLYTIYLLPIASQMWGINSLSPIIPVKNSFIYQVTNLLQFSNVNQYYYIFIGLQLLLLVFGLIKSSTRVISIFLYILTINLFNKTYLMNTGAQQIVSLTLLFMVLIDLNYKSKKPALNLVNTALSNIGIMACKIQILVLYFFSALYKYYGELWLNGDALYYALKIEDYNPIWLTGFIDQNNLILQIANFVVLAYLTLFPLLIWVKRIKLKLLLFGAIFHFGIAFVMGIIDFGIAMMMVYLIFIPNKQAKYVLELFKLGTKKKAD